MKKYSFRLQTVLEMREKKLEEQRRQMAVIVAKLNQQNEVLDNIKNNQTKVLNNLENIYNSGKELDILEVTNHKDYFGQLIIDTKKQQEVVKKTEVELQVIQFHVREALKAVKVLEKLKEKQEKDFYRHYEYLQAKEIDDIASTRYRKAS